MSLEIIIDNDYYKNFSSYKKEKEIIERKKKEKIEKEEKNMNHQGFLYFYVIYF